MVGNDGDAGSTPSPRPTEGAPAPIPREGSPTHQPLARNRVSLCRQQLVSRQILVGLAFLVPSLVLALDVFFIVKAPSRTLSSGVIASAAVVATPGAPEHAVGPFQGVASARTSNAPSAVSEPSGPVFDEEGNDERRETTIRAPKHFATVQEAAAGSCSTVSIEGLSRQILEQTRCIDPQILTPLPALPNLLVGSHVFPYLEVRARDHLVRALRAHPSTAMTVNSAFRTVAQQYLVWRWSVNKRCGVQLATPPGKSNHELGLALDIANQAAWRSALEAEKFRWLGTTDRVHFDYRGAEGTPRKATDVLAFQKLWNLNHPGDRIAESGRYSAETERRLQKAPADGFQRRSTCKSSRISTRPKTMR